MLIGMFRYCRIPCLALLTRPGLVNPFTPRVSHGDTKVFLTFYSVDETLWCDTQMKPLQQYFPIVLFIIIYILEVYKMKFGIRLEV